MKKRKNCRLIVREMFIDEEKIRKKSNSLSGGFKGVVPRFNKNRKKTPLDMVRMVIGFSLTAALVAGTAILFYNLVSAGKGIAESKLKKNDVKYIEVIYKPNKK